MDITNIGHTVRVCVVYVPEDGKVPEILLVLERPIYLFEADMVWKIPGGEYEPQKDKGFVEAALRELLEEAGIFIHEDRLSVDHVIGVYGPSRNPNFDRHVRNLFMVPVKRKPKQVNNNLDPDIIAVRWFPISDLPSEKRPVEGAPLASSHWGYLHRIFTDSINRQALNAAGLNDRRIEGIIKAWRKRGKLLNPA